MNSLRSSRLHENIQSLIIKLTFLFLFMINYVLKREKLLIPHTFTSFQ